MWEWMYRSTFLDLGTSWRWVVNFTPRSHLLMPRLNMRGAILPLPHFVSWFLLKHRDTFSFYLCYRCRYISRNSLVYRYRSKLLFQRFLVRISVGRIISTESSFSWSTRPHSDVHWDCAPIRPQPLSSETFPLHCSPVSLIFSAAYSTYWQRHQIDNNETRSHFG
jgi:hypothetical protein